MVTDKGMQKSLLEDRQVTTAGKTKEDEIQISEEMRNFKHQKA